MSAFLNSRTKLSELLDSNLLITDLSAKDTKDCLEKMVNVLSYYRVIADPSDALEKLIEREKVMSTGIGGGVAIPHARCTSVSKTIVSIALSKDEIDFQSLDGEPVKIVFLILGPPESAAHHVKLLAQIARLIKDKRFVEELARAQTPARIIELIRAEELQESKEDGVE